MAAAVQVGALVINMAADIAALKTNLAEATRASQTAAQKMSADLTAGLKSIEAALQPLQSLTVKFGTLESQMHSARESAMSLAKGLIIGSAAGMSIDALKNKILGVVESMAHLKDVSEKTGSSVESLSKIGFAAKQSGSDIDSVAAAINKLSKGMAGADDETKGAGLALSFLGVSAKDAAGNLKDPAQLFTEIAKKLDGYRDGAGKAAIAQTLFGKSGADMLPTLKLLGEQGETVAKVTDAQATAARQYTRDVAKLEAQKGMLFKTVATALLPTMTDFANAMLDASKNTSTLGKNVKGVADDGSIMSWADSAAMGVARLIDVIIMIPKALAAAGSSFRVVYSDMKALGAGLVDLSPKNIAKSIAAGKNPFADLNAAIADRNKVLADANAKYADLWNYDGAAMEKAMAARIAARAKDTASAKAAEQARTAADAAKPALNFDLSNDGKAAAEAEKEATAYATLIAAIHGKTDENKLELATNQALTDGQKMQIKLDAELASGKLKLIPAHEAAARAALDELQVTEQAVKLQASQREVTQYIAESTRARQDSSAALNVEYAMYGKSADARAIAMAGVEAETWKEKELAKLRAENKPISDQIINQLNAEANARALVNAATIGQTKALQYASQLAEENKRFGVDYILDEKQRAAAVLAIDAQAWQERIRLAGDGTDAQKLLQEQYATWYQNQLLKPQLDEQKRIWQSIEQTAHDTFISIFDSGKSAFNRLRDALKNGLLDLLYQMTLRPWIISIGASVGMGSVAGAGQSGIAGSSPLVGAAQTASSLYKAISGGFAGIGATVGQGVTWLGNATGINSVAAFGKGMQGWGADGSLGQAAGYGQMAGTALGYGAGLLGGHYLGNAIAGGYSIGDHGQAVTNIASVVGAIVGGPIGAAIGGAIGGIANRLFGMGSKDVTGAGMRGTISDTGLTGENYSNWFQKGGLFRSDKSGTDTTGFSADITKQFTQGFAALEDASKGFAQSIGASAGALTGYSKAFDITLGSDAAANQKAITDFFAGVGDEMAKKLVPNLDQFAKSGETASATLQRLAGDFDATNQMAMLLGKSSVDVFGALGMDSAAARERLVDLSGGVSALSQQASYFAQNFLSDAERLKPVQESVNAAMTSLGLAWVQTRDQFKSVVQSLDLTTEAGAQEYTSLMKLADAFAQVHPAIDTTTKALQDQAAAQQAVKDSASTLLGSVDSAFTALQAVAAREKATIQTQVDATNKVITGLSSLSQALHGTLDAMRVPDQAVYDRAAAQAQIKTSLAIAKAGGPLPPVDALKQALGTVQQDASGQFATYQDYLADFYSTKNDIASLAGMTDNSLSVEQKSLDTLNAQLKSIDDMVAGEQERIDLLKGQSTTQLSMLQALEGIRTAILAAQANPVVAATQAVNTAYQKSLGRAPDAAGLAFWQNQAAAGVSVDSIVNAIGSSPEATIQGMYQTMLGRSADAAGLNFWMGQLGKGVSLSAIGSAIAGSNEATTHAGIPGFATGGDFGGGLRIVGENGPELEATGPARIFNAQQTSSLLARIGAPSDSSAALVAEVRALRAEVAQLRKDNSAENFAIAKHSMKSADALEGAVNGVRPIVTAATPA